MKVQANKKKYDALIITPETSKDTVGNFVGCHNAVSYKLNGIGFTADRTLLLQLDSGCKMPLNPGTVIIKSKEMNFGFMTRSTYNLIFDEIKEEKK